MVYSSKVNNWHTDIKKWNMITHIAALTKKTLCLECRWQGFSHNFQVFAEICNVLKNSMPNALIVHLCAILVSWVMFIFIAILRSTRVVIVCFSCYFFFRSYARFTTKQNPACSKNLHENEEGCWESIWHWNCYLSLMCCLVWELLKCLWTVGNTILKVHIRSACASDTLSVSWIWTDLLYFSNCQEENIELLWHLFFRD